MTRTIGGALNMDAYGALTGRAEADRTRHFRVLDHGQQVAAIRRLAVSGQGEHTIAQATGLSVEAVRAILTERPA